MWPSDPTDGTISSVNSGHLRSVFCGQSTSVLTTRARNSSPSARCTRDRQDGPPRAHDPLRFRRAVVWRSVPHRPRPPLSEPNAVQPVRRTCSCARSPQPAVTVPSNRTRCAPHGVTSPELRHCQTGSGRRLKRPTGGENVLWPLPPLPKHFSWFLALPHAFEWEIFPSYFLLKFLYSLSGFVGKLGGVFAVHFSTSHKI